MGQLVYKGVNLNRLFSTLLFFVPAFSYGAVGDILLTIDSPGPGNFRRFGDVISATGNVGYVRNIEPNTATLAEGKVYQFDLDTGSMTTTYTLPASVALTNSSSNVEVIAKVMASSANHLVFDYTDKNSQRDSARFSVGTTTPLFNDTDPNNAPFLYYSAVVVEDQGLFALGAKGDTLGGQVHLFSLATGAYLRSIFNSRFDAASGFGHFIAYDNNLIVIAEDTRVNVYSSTGEFKYFISQPTEVSFSSGYMAVGSGYLAVTGEDERTISGVKQHPFYIYKLNDSGATLERTILNPSINDISTAKNFSLAIAGNVVAWGEPNKNVSSISGTGRIYFYSITTGQLLQTVDNPMIPVNPQWAQNSLFGCRIVPAGKNFLVGMPDWIGAFGTTDVGRAYLISGDQSSNVDCWNLY